MAKSAAGTYVFNERKMLDASHVVVFLRENRDDDARWNAWWIRRGRWPFQHARSQRRTIKVVPTSLTCTVWI